MELLSESTVMVRPEHLNHHGYLFGGKLLEWLDEQAYIAAMTQVQPDTSLVTVAIDRVEFRVPVGQGALLHFRSALVHAGRSSLTVFTRVYRHLGLPDEEIFRAYVTLVCLDAAGRPRPVAPLLLRPLSRDTLPDAEARGYWDEVERTRKTKNAPASAPGRKPAT